MLMAQSALMHVGFFPFSQTHQFREGYFQFFFIYDLVPKFQKSNVWKKYRCEYPNSYESLHGSYIQNASLTSSILGIMQFCFKDKDKGEYPHLSFILRLIFQSLNSDIQCNMCCHTYARFQNCPDKNATHFSHLTHSSRQVTTVQFRETAAGNCPDRKLFHCFGVSCGA